MSQGDSETWRIIFMGSPEFACPSLTSLVKSEDEVCLVVTQPDRPSGRGRKMSPPAVKSLALEHDLPVWQPESVKGPDALSYLKDYSPDLLVVVAYGLLLPRPLLDLPRIGPLNLHPSLLPDYRGAAPINWAIVNGETETGVTTMFLNEGMDCGPTLLSQKVKIGETETAGELHDRLAVIGADLVMDTITALKTGNLKPAPQPPECPNECRLLKKEDGLIDWTRTADELSARIRGLDPWPGAFTTYKGKNLKLFGARPGPGQGEPGQVLSLEADSLHVAAGQGSVAIREFQIAGKKRQTASQFKNGHRLTRDDFFGRE